jgi:hypothetical protein
MVVRNRKSNANSNKKDNSSNCRSDNDDNDNSIVTGALILICTLMVLGIINYLSN